MYHDESAKIAEFLPKKKSKKNFGKIFSRTPYTKWSLFISRWHILLAKGTLSIADSIRLGGRVILPGQLFHLVPKFLIISFWFVKFASKFYKWGLELKAELLWSRLDRQSESVFSMSITSDCLMIENGSRYRRMACRRPSGVNRGRKIVTNFQTFQQNIEKRPWLNCKILFIRHYRCRKPTKEGAVDFVGTFLTFFRRNFRYTVVAR